MRASIIEVEAIVSGAGIFIETRNAQTRKPIMDFTADQGLMSHCRRGRCAKSRGQGEAGLGGVARRRLMEVTRRVSTHEMLTTGAVEHVAAPLYALRDSLEGLVWLTSRTAPTAALAGPHPNIAAPLSYP